MQITLEAARKNAKLTQEEVANKIGVCTKTISHWETGKHKIKADALAVLAGIYNVKTDRRF